MELSTRKGRSSQTDVVSLDMKNKRSSHVTTVAVVTLTVLLLCTQPTEASFDIVKSLTSFIPDSVSRTVQQWDILGLKPDNATSVRKSSKTFKRVKPRKQEPLFEDDDFDLPTTDNALNTFQPASNRKVKLRLYEASGKLGDTKQQPKTTTVHEDSDHANDNPVLSKSQTKKAKNSAARNVVKGTRHLNINLQSITAKPVPETESSRKADDITGSDVDGLAMLQDGQTRLSELEDDPTKINAPNILEFGFPVTTEEYNIPLNIVKKPAVKSPATSKDVHKEKEAKPSSKTTSRREQPTTTPPPSVQLQAYPVSRVQSVTSVKTSMDVVSSKLKQTKKLNPVKSVAKTTAESGKSTPKEVTDRVPLLNEKVKPEVRDKTDVTEVEILKDPYNDDKQLKVVDVPNSRKQKVGIKLHTTRSPLHSDYPTTPMDDNMYEVTTEGIKNWQEMMHRINAEEDDLNDDFDEDFLIRVRRGGAASTTTEDPNTVTDACACVPPGYCNRPPAQSCNCAPRRRGKKCLEEISAAVSNSKTVGVDLQMEGDVSSVDLYQLSDSLAAIYEPHLNLERIHITNLTYDPVTNTTTVEYDIISTTPIDADDVTNLASLSRDAIQSSLPLNLGTATTALVPDVGFFVFPTENDTPEPKVPIVLGSAGGKDIDDVCFLFNERKACKNSGFCEPSNSTATCSCTTGWIGEYCQWPVKITEDQTENYLKILLPVLFGVLACLALLSCCCIMFFRRGHRGESDSSSTESVPRSFLVIPGPFFTRSQPQEWKQFYPGPRSIEDPEPPLHRDDISETTTSNSVRSWRSHESMNYPDYQIPRPTWETRKNDVFF